jgi:hypothetical protein
VVVERQDLRFSERSSFSRVEVAVAGPSSLDEENCLRSLGRTGSKSHTKPPVVMALCRSLGEITPPN